MPTVEIKSDVFISVKDAAAMIGCTVGRVRQLLIAGTLKGVKLNERAWAVRKESAKRFSAKPRRVGRPKSKE